MKTAPIAPAQIRFEAGQPPVAPAYSDRYHPSTGWLEQARHVFLAGNGLPGRWAGRERFVIAETGFGLGGNFIATLQAWHDDAHRSKRLHYVAMDLHPPSADDLARAWAERATTGRMGDDVRLLLAQWPPLVPMLHRLRFANGAVELLLGFGDATDWLRALSLQADAIYLDGFAPDRNPAMWRESLWPALARCAAPDATAATWSAARVLREGMAGAGFQVERSPGLPPKRDMTAARFAPHRHPQRAPARRVALELPRADRRALVIGAGIAGVCAAAALADAGWQPTLIEATPDGAPGGASALPAGIVRAMATQDDSLHARIHHAAALSAIGFYREALAALPDGDSLGRFDGVALCAPGGAAQGETAVATPGGWIAPTTLLRELPRQLGVATLAGRAVAALHQDGPMWHAVDAAGQLIGKAPLVVLAHADAAAALVPWAAWPMQRRRGQLTLLHPHGRRVPPVPLVGQGHAIALPDGLVLAGSTSANDDNEAVQRIADHAANRGTLARLTGDTRWLESAYAAPMAATVSSRMAPTATIAAAAVHDLAGGFVGWRAVLPDRLPLVGPVPLNPTAWPPGARAHPVRLVPRSTGLFVVAGLGSRGLTWGPLAGQVIAALVSGAPVPLESDLLDAIDPARFLSRAAARAGH